MLSWNEAVRDFSNPRLSPWSRLDYEDQPAAVVYRLEVPGYKKRHIDVEVRDRQVVVRGSRKEGWLRPRRAESFVRAFSLDDRLDENHIRADLKKGLLTITVAKRPEARARRIEIRYH